MVNHPLTLELEMQQAQIYEALQDHHAHQNGQANIAAWYYIQQYYILIFRQLDVTLD